MLLPSFLSLSYSFTIYSEEKKNVLVLLSQLKKKEAYMNKLLIYMCICLFLSKTFESSCPPIISNLLWFNNTGQRLQISAAVTIPTVLSLQQYSNQQRVLILSLYRMFLLFSSLGSFILQYWHSLHIRSNRKLFSFAQLRTKAKLNTC